MKLPHGVVTVDRDAASVAHSAYLLDSPHGAGTHMVVTTNVRVKRALFAYEYAKASVAAQKKEGAEWITLPSQAELTELIRQMEERS